MFWFGGHTDFLTRLLASWGIALTMLGSVVAAEHSVEIQHGQAASSTVMPAVEVSDTAIQQIAQRLTQANWNSKSLASMSVQQSGSRSPLIRYGADAEQRAVPQCCSLLILGTALRL